MAAGTAAQTQTFITVGQNFRMEVRSLASTQVIHTLGTAPGAVTVSPDGSTVYYQGEGQGPAFPIYSIPAGGGEPTQVGSGSAPAVSPDGTRLAFAEPDGKNLGLYDTTHRLNFTVDLSALLAADANLSNTGTLVTWVTNDLLLVVPVQNASMAIAAQAQPSTPPPLNAIVIDLTAREPARALTFTLPGSVALSVTAWNDEPGTILIGSRNAIYRVKVTPTSVTLVATMTIPGPSVQIQALSPDGRNVLYLQRGGVGTPPSTVGANPAQSVIMAPGMQLWEGTIGNGVVVPTRLLIDDAHLYKVAW